MTMTPAAVEQRREASRHSRPGRRKDTRTEELRRARAVKIGRRLDLDAVLQAQRSIKIGSKLLARIEAEVNAEIPDWDALERLTRVYRNLELDRTREGIQDRFGTPKRSSHDVKVEGAIGQLFANIPESWTKPPAENDRPAAGNAHGVAGS